MQLLLLPLLLLPLTDAQSDCPIICVYGVCSGDINDDVTCVCTPGYTGKYCNVLDTSEITVLTSAHAAVLQFNKHIVLTDLIVSLTPNDTSTDVIYRHLPHSIGIRNLRAETTYRVCCSLQSINESTPTISPPTIPTLSLLDDKRVQLSSIAIACVTVITKKNLTGRYKLWGIICGCVLGAVVLVLICWQLGRMCFEKRELLMFNVAERDEQGLEGIVFDIMESRLDMEKARQKIILYKVFRSKGRSSDSDDASNDDVTTRPVVVWFRKGKDRKSVLASAKRSSKVMVDHNRILLPPGAGY